MENKVIVIFTPSPLKNDIPEKKYYCGFCDEKFFTLLGLGFHQEHYHNIPII